jgi:hypothetical protein
MNGFCGMSSVMLVLSQQNRLPFAAIWITSPHQQQRRRALMALVLKLDWVLGTLAFLLITGIVVGVI